MVLIDTSVWVRALSGRAPFREQVDWLLQTDQVLRHPLIFGELLIGDKGGRAGFLLDYELNEQAVVVPHGEVVHLVRARRLVGEGLGWIDAHLLASSLAGGHKLWSADASLSGAANRLNVGYSPSKPASAP